MRNAAFAACVALVAANSHAQEATSTPETWVEGRSQCWAGDSADRVIDASPANDDEARSVSWARRHDLTALCLYEAAAWWALADIERGGELLALAQIRARYDVLRCRDPEEAQAAMSAFRVAAVGASRGMRAKMSEELASEHRASPGPGGRDVRLWRSTARRHMRRRGRARAALKVG